MHLRLCGRQLSCMQAQRFAKELGNLFAQKEVNGRSDEIDLGSCSTQARSCAYW